MRSLTYFTGVAVAVAVAVAVVLLWLSSPSLAVLRLAVPIGISSAFSS